MNKRYLYNAGLAGAFACVFASAVYGESTRAATSLDLLEQSANTVLAFPSTPAPAPKISNQDVRDIFIALSFMLEDGKRLPVFSRFETPIRVRVIGKTPKIMQYDLKQLLGRLRNEARIDIRLTSGADYNVTVHAVAQAKIQEHLPMAACFVATGVSNLDEYARSKRSSKTDWARLAARDKVAVFIPNDTSAQVMRDCLNEELAQAIGPLNDLYSVKSSVFNDDNFHTIVTGLDMLILRAYYDPALLAGMSPQEVVQELPTILARLNPSGERMKPRGLGRTPIAWSNAIATAMGPQSSVAQRHQAANVALQIAAAQGWQDHRRAYSYYVRARVTEMKNPRLSQNDYRLAYKLYSHLEEAELHRAFIVPTLAAHALENGQAQNALDYLIPAEKIAFKYQSAGILADILMLRAKAHEMLGQTQEARATRLDSIGWARYAFGSEQIIEDKLNQVARLGQ